MNTPLLGEQPSLVGQATESAYAELKYTKGNPKVWSVVSLIFTTIAAVITVAAGAVLAGIITITSPIWMPIAALVGGVALGVILGCKTAQLIKQANAKNLLNSPEFSSKMNEAPGDKGELLRTQWLDSLETVLIQKGKVKESFLIDGSPLTFTEYFCLIVPDLGIQSDLIEQMIRQGRFTLLDGLDLKQLISIERVTEVSLECDLRSRSFYQERQWKPGAGDLVRIIERARAIQLTSPESRTIERPHSGNNFKDFGKFYNYSDRNAQHYTMGLTRANNQVHWYQDVWEAQLYAPSMTQASELAKLSPQEWGALKNDGLAYQEDSRLIRDFDPSGGLEPVLKAAQYCHAHGKRGDLVVRYFLLAAVGYHNCDIPSGRGRAIADDVLALKTRVEAELNAEHRGVNKSFLRALQPHLVEFEAGYISGY